MSEDHTQLLGVWKVRSLTSHSEILLADGSAQAWNSSDLLVWITLFVIDLASLCVAAAA